MLDSKFVRGFILVPQPGFSSLYHEWVWWQ